MTQVRAVKAVESLKIRGAVYKRLGVRPIINANGTQTTLGGSIMEPEVAQAMADASRTMVSMKELNERAGEIVAEHTGAEAGLVSAGGAAGMMLQAAACIAGADPEKIVRLPNSEGMRNEIVIKRNHDNQFVQAWVQAGAKPIWVGDSTGAQDWEIESAINGNTTALAFIASRWHPDSFDGLNEMARIAHDHSLPLIVDAAAMLPPAENLRRFIQYGADMVSFSGGKAIKGPQSTGVLCGRKDLIEAASLNNSPHASVGRPAKVCKEEIVGQITALERYVQRDHQADQQRWRDECQIVVDTIMEIPGVKATIEQDDWERPVPEVSIILGPQWNRPSAEVVANTLATGDPPIMIEASRREGEDLFVNPHGLLEGEAELVAQRLRAALEGCERSLCSVQLQLSPPC